jgi:hypothetical protein
MTDDEKWQFVENTLNETRELLGKFEAVCDPLMLEAGSPVTDPMYCMQDLVVEALSKLCGDKSDSINWFVAECNYGLEPKEAGCSNDMRLIDSVERLRWLVELDCFDR